MLYGEESRLAVDKYIKLVDGAGGIEVLPFCGRLEAQVTYGSPRKAHVAVYAKYQKM
jgi:hypothetical protein